MKRIGLLLLALVLSTGIFAQYYYVPYINAGENPKGLNTDNEYPKGGGLATGWDVILAGKPASPSWSAVQNIPFTFEFNGKAVTQYKVSSTGVLTFTTSATTVPDDKNIALPTSLLPDNSVCLWGLHPATASDLSSYPNIVAKVFGTAPNRQLYVSFNTYATTDIKDGWAFWSIVLEETSNNIYFCDQRTYCRTGTGSAGKKCTDDVQLTVGIQIDSLTAYSVKGSPAVGSYNTGSSTPGDNSFYQFIFGTQPQYDLALTGLDLEKIVPVNKAAAITGTVKNLGSETITEFDIVYTIDNGTEVSKTLSSLNIAAGDDYSFTAMPWTPATAGKYYDFKIYSKNLNTTYTDEVTSNDELNMKVFVNEGITGKKRVLIEQGTGAWCGFCPDGSLRLKEILDNNAGNVIAIAHHNNDGMAFTDGNAINAAYASGYPTGYVDRVKYDEYDKVGFTRSAWATKAAERLNAVTPLNIEIQNLVYNPDNGKLDFDVEIEFVDYAYGDLRITVMLKEDYVVGTGSQYNQANYYNTTAGHALYGLGHPIVGYEHMLVSRDFLTQTWGDQLDPAGEALFNKGDKIKKSFSTKIVNWDAGKMHAIAMVSFYNDDIENREVLNTVEAKVYTSSLIDVVEAQNVGEVYPNPVNGVSRIDFELENTSDVSFRIYNSMGQIVHTKENQKYAAGNNSIFFSAEELESGSYFAVITIDGINHSRTFFRK